MTNKLHISPSRLWRLLALALPLAACTSEVTDEALPAGASPIAFRVPEVTKAVVDDNNPMTEFSVWGWYGDDASKTEVFNAQKVEFIDNAWTYSPYRYWQAGETYRFYAVYPTKETLAGDGCTASYSDAGALSITGFDATNGHDLMTSSATADGDDKPLVAFTFNHLLSRVNIRVIGEGGDVVISQATLSGVKTKGDYNSNNAGNPWTLENASYSFEAKDVTATSIPSCLFAEDLLVQPQEVKDFTLSVTYSLAGFAGTQDSKSVTLPAGEIAQWESGKSYTYTLTLTNDYIFFSKPQVNAWGEGSGGIIIVD